MPESSSKQKYCIGIHGLPLAALLTTLPVIPLFYRLFMDRSVARCFQEAN